MSHTSRKAWLTVVAAVCMLAACKSEEQKICARMAAEAKRAGVVDVEAQMASCRTEVKARLETCEDRAAAVKCYLGSSSIVGCERHCSKTAESDNRPSPEPGPGGGGGSGNGCPNSAECMNSCKAKCEAQHGPMSDVGKMRDCIKRNQKDPVKCADVGINAAAAACFKSCRGLR